MAVALAEGIYWVGAIDWNLRDFHGYSIHRGTTYNAYLIIDEKIALIDTVKANFYGEMLNRIKEVVDPGAIDYVISNHVEMDHSGALPQILGEARKATVVTSEKFGEAGLRRTFHADWPLMAVKEGSELNLGRRTLTFVPLPMLHWPDSMAAYSPADHILFSNDAFGQHLATSGRFDDEVDLEMVMAEAAKYYATILMPFGDLILRALDKLGRLEIKMIAPSHGVIWRSHLDRIKGAYVSWARGEAERRVVVVYDTMWGSTEKMALALVEGVAAEGVEARLLSLTHSDSSDVIREVMEAKALVVGSCTLNNSMLPTVAAFLHNLKGLKPRGKVGAAFGSYGWGGGAVKAIEGELRQATVEVLDSGLGFRFVPSPEDLERCFEFGGRIAQRIK